MNNLTAEHKLVAILQTTCKHPQMDCALSRASTALGCGALVDLRDVGAMLGFSEGESKGIMDGWDVTTAKRDKGVFATVGQGDLSGYANGFRIGAEAAKRYA